MPMTPQQWYFLMEQMASMGQGVFSGQGGGSPQAASSGNNTEPTPTPFGGGIASTPAPYEHIPGKSSSQTSPRGQGPTVTPTPSMTGGIDIPPAVGGNEPSTAPYNQDLGSTTDNPFARGYSASVPDTWNPPTNDTGVIPTGPNDYLPSAGANIPTNDTGMVPFDVGSYFPSSGLNLPTQEQMQPVDQPQYTSTAPANVPTNEGMMPTGPNDYLPSAGANVPTSEAMLPTGPSDQYLPSTAGANIPTDESNNVTPTNTYYPAGDGTYIPLDAQGQPVGTGNLPTGPDQQQPQTFQAPPQLSDRPFGTSTDTNAPNLGGWGQPMGYFPSGTAGPGPLPQNFFDVPVAQGGGTPATGPYHSAGGIPAPGSISGVYGQGSLGNIPALSRLAMAAYNRGQPMMGFGNDSAISRYGRFMNASGGHMATPSWSDVGQYFTNQGGAQGETDSQIQPHPTYGASVSAK